MTASWDAEPLPDNPWEKWGWAFAAIWLVFLAFPITLPQLTALAMEDDPRQLVTTTPRPVPILKRLIAEEGTRLVTVHDLNYLYGRNAFSRWRHHRRTLKAMRRLRWRKRKFWWGMIA